MKKIILIITIGLIFYNCKAQSPVLNMETTFSSDVPVNAYYKDANNILNNFEGTWLYTNGNNSLKIILVKSTQHFNGKYYEDLLIGGYQYIENGVEKINTLTDADNLNLGDNASIEGNNIYNNCKYSPVDDCVDGEKNLHLSIKDVPLEGHIGDLRLFKRTINGQEVLKVNISMNYLRDVSGELPDPTLPWKMENIVLIKQ
ncbi:DUF6705 family protein [Olleya sp. ITB9]|uniref:DUF6705 family protein n=1 Tax=Olleya sp. ITB9 TaxID=1715648 RepID=UPI0006D13198